MAQLEDLNGIVLGHGGRDDDVFGRRNKDLVSAAQQLACQRAFRVASEIVQEQGLLGLYQGLSSVILKHL
ncbi:hypothetical protein ACFX2I_022248 [Malus domestica]|uniref:Uncharacterized protein n=1 Tax=Malus domestica TaxID=3750 RepID=A0A498HIG0_MALDO|nr:hypothetical protein DVH24_013525 [Malus domestica]